MSTLNNVIGSANDAYNAYRDIKRKPNHEQKTEYHSTSPIPLGNGDFKTRFRKFGVLDDADYDPHLSGYCYIFVTTPSIWTSQSGFPESKYNQLYGNGLHRHLDSNINPSPFIKFLTNLHDNIPENDWSSDPIKGWENFKGRSVSYGKGHSIDVGIDFNIEYHETQELMVTNMHRIWMDTMNGLANGKYVRHPDMFDQGRIDYTSSIYVINTLADGETICYWSKYTGVFPTSLGYSGLGVGKRGDINVVDKISIGYHASARETMSYSILQDFAEVAGAYSSAPLGEIMDAGDMSSRPIDSGSVKGGSNATDWSNIHDSRSAINYFFGSKQDMNTGGGGIYNVGTEFEATDMVGLSYAKDGKIKLKFK